MGCCISIRRMEKIDETEESNSENSKKSKILNREVCKIFKI